MGWPADGYRLVRSPRALLGSVAMLDLLGFLRLFDSAPDWFAPAISVGASLIAPRSLVDGLTWVLFILAFLVFAPRLYPSASGLPREAAGFRAIVSLSSVGIGMAMVSLVGPVLAFAVAGLFFSTGFTLVFYLTYWRGWDVLNAEDPPVGLVESFAPFGDVRQEIKRDLRRDGALGVLGASLWVAGLAIVLAIPCLLASILVMVLYSADPLPDLLVLGWVVVGVLEAAVPGFDLPDPPEFEADLVRGIGDATRGFQGIFLSFFAVVGLLLAAGHILIALSISDVVLDMAPLIPHDVVFVSAWVATVACLLAAGVYGLWFWYRELRRIPAFLDEWVGDRSRPAPRRPPGLTLPMVLVAVIPIFLVGGFESAPWTIRVLGLGWPLLVAALVVVARSTRLIGRRSVAREDLVVTLSLTIQLLELWLFGAGEELWLLKAGTVPQGLVDPTVPTMIVLVVAASLYPHVERFQDTGNRPFANYGVPIYLSSLALLTAVLALAHETITGLLLATIAAVSLLGSIGLAITTFFDL